MNREDLYNSLQEVDEEVLERSETAGARRRKGAWLKWTAAAACLCLAVGAVMGVYLSMGTKNEPARPPVAERGPGKEAAGPMETVSYGSTSDTYQDLPQLLAYLSGHDSHGDRKVDAEGGSGVSGARGEAAWSGEEEFTESTGVAVNDTGEYAYHSGEDCIFISRLEGKNPQNVGRIQGAADGIFVRGSRLLTVLEYPSGGDELDREMSVRACIYDITVPENPRLLEEYIQLGELTACWMAGEKLYLVTSDGVCACGWSRLEDTAAYYPSLSHNGEMEDWEEQEIFILGEPVSVRYSAVTVIDADGGQVVKKEALYGNIQELFFGEDWIAASVAGTAEDYVENPLLYTFDEELHFTGKIDLPQLLGAPAKNTVSEGMPADGGYLNLVSATKAGETYRILGTYRVLEEEAGSDFFLAVAADPKTGEAGFQLLSAEAYPYGSYTEILWEPDRAIACIGTMEDTQTGDMIQETRFLFAGFTGLQVQFYENELRGDYLNLRVGSGYGSPLGQFETLIPMGNGSYVRYSHPAEGPGGFDVFDFSDSAAPGLCYRSENSLSGRDAFDYVWYVHDEHTFGTLKVLLGEEDFFRDVGLAWCEYDVDSQGEESRVLLLQEDPLGEEIQSFFGADGIGFVVFEVKGQLYYVTRERECAAAIG